MGEVLHPSFTIKTLLLSGVTELVPLETSRAIDLISPVHAKGESEEQRFCMHNRLNDDVNSM